MKKQGKILASLVLVTAFVISSLGFVRSASADDTYLGIYHHTDGHDYGVTLHSDTAGKRVNFTYTAERMGGHPTVISVTINSMEGTSVQLHSDGVHFTNQDGVQKVVTVEGVVGPNY